MVRIAASLDTDLELYAIGGGWWDGTSEPKKRGPKRRYNGSDVGAKADVEDYFCKPEGMYEKARAKLRDRHRYTLKDGNFIDGKPVTVQEMFEIAELL